MFLYKEQIKPLLEEKTVFVAKRVLLFCANALLLPMATNAWAGSISGGGGSMMVCLRDTASFEEVQKKHHGLIPIEWKSAESDRIQSVVFLDIWDALKKTVKPYIPSDENLPVEKYINLIADRYQYNLPEIANYLRQTSLGIYEQIKLAKKNVTDHPKGLIQAHDVNEVDAGADDGENNCLIRPVFMQTLLGDASYFDADLALYNHPKHTHYSMAVGADHEAIKRRALEHYELDINRARNVSGEAIDGRELERHDLDGKRVRILTGYTLAQNDGTTVGAMRNYFHSYDFSNGPESTYVYQQLKAMFVDLVGRLSQIRSDCKDKFASTLMKPIQDAGLGIWEDSSAIRLMANLQVHYDAVPEDLRRAKAAVAEARQDLVRANAKRKGWLGEKPDTELVHGTTELLNKRILNLASVEKNTRAIERLLNETRALVSSCTETIDQDIRNRYKDYWKAKFDLATGVSDIMRKQIQDAINTELRILYRYKYARYTSSKYDDWTDYNDLRPDQAEFLFEKFTTQDYFNAYAEIAENLVINVNFDLSAPFPAFGPLTEAKP